MIKDETLDTDQYEITRKLAGTKELRFKQIAVSELNIFGLTEDGIVYYWPLDADKPATLWERNIMRARK